MKSPYWEREPVFTYRSELSPKDNEEQDICTILTELWVTVEREAYISQCDASLAKDAFSPQNVKFDLSTIIPGLSPKDYVVKCGTQFKPRRLDNWVRYLEDLQELLQKTINTHCSAWVNAHSAPFGDSMAFWEDAEKGPSHWILVIIQSKRKASQGKNTIDVELARQKDNNKVLTKGNMGDYQKVCSDFQKF